MSDIVSLVVASTGEKIAEFTSFSIQQDFLTPCAGWSLETGDAATIARIRRSLRPGTFVQLVVNGAPHITGPAGKFGIKGLTGMSVAGRDALGVAVDACLDPTLVFTPGTTMGDVFQAIFTPLGFDRLSTTDIFNRRAMSGINPAKAGSKVIQAASTVPNETIDTNTGAAIATGTFTTVPAVTELFDPTAPKSIKTLPIDQFKPTAGEGTFEFWSRLIKRFGLWTWCSGDGKTLIVDAPDFDQAPSYSIVRRIDGVGNNVEKDGGELELDGEEQPSVIIATGSGGGGFRDHATLKVAMVNELTGCDSSGGILPAVQATINRFPGIHVLPIRPRLLPLAAGFSYEHSRPRFLHDDESRNQGQLEAFVQRAMAEHQKRAVTLKYTLTGLSQNGTAFVCNTIAHVQDEVAGVEGRFWVMARELAGGRPGGTHTTLTLIPPGCLDLIA